MSGSSEAVATAMDWLLEEISRTPFGRVSIGVQMHDGKVAKVFKSVEESTLASQNKKGHVDGRNR
jgi:hypothetical protein